MSRPLRVGHIDLSFHDASAIEIERVLTARGHKVERSAAPHEEMFRHLGVGQIDILVSAWLPASHGAYLAPIEDQIRKITVLYEPYCIWGVPDFVPEDDVNSVTDLLRPPALERMERLIQGINPGAGISRFSAAMMLAYGLSDAGYQFRTGSEAECFDRFEAAVQAGDWVIIPLWHPQYLHHRHRIRSLKEPKGLLGGVDQATLLVRRDAEGLVGTEALATLSAFHLGNDLVSALDDELRQSVLLALPCPEARKG